MEQMKITHAEIVLFERLIENEIERVVEFNEMFDIPTDKDLPLEIKRLKLIKQRLSMARYFYPISQS